MGPFITATSRAHVTTLDPDGISADHASMKIRCASLASPRRRGVSLAVRSSLDHGACASTQSFLPGCISVSLACTPECISFVLFLQAI